VLLGVIGPAHGQMAASPTASLISTLPHSPGRTDCGAGTRCSASSAGSRPDGRVSTLPNLRGRTDCGSGRRGA